MSGSKIGGGKAAITNKLRYGADYYARIGAMGGEAGHTGGFAAEQKCDGTCGIYVQPHRKAQCAGYKGGMKSRRKKNRV